MSVLPQLMEFVSLRKVCDAVGKEEIDALQRGVEEAKSANKRLAPNREVLEINLSKLAKAQELLDMKSYLLQEEARLAELVAKREQLLLTRISPAHVMEAKENELDAVTKFVREYQRYRKTCPSLSQGHDVWCPNQHRCKNCAIDDKCDEEDGPLFKKKCATLENPRGSLELHSKDKLHFYLLETDEMIVIDKATLTDDVESSISSKTLESVISESEVLSESESDGESTMCASLSSIEFYSPSCSEVIDFNEMKELVNERCNTRRNCTRHFGDMRHRHETEERLFRQTTNELMARYGIDKRSNQHNHYQNSRMFCPAHSPRPFRMAFDDSRRSARVVTPKKYMCENCVKKLMSGSVHLQRPCASSYSARSSTQRPPTPWSATSNPRNLNVISSSFQHAFWPKTSTRRRFF